MSDVTENQKCPSCLHDKLLHFGPNDDGDCVAQPCHSRGGQVTIEIWNRCNCKWYLERQMELRFDDPTPRRFILVRDKDISGISGTGKVASGCVFQDGSAVLHWNTEVFSTTVFQDIKELEKLHGHDGATRIEFIEEPKGFEPRTAVEDLVYSNTSQGDRVLTWKELYEETKVRIEEYRDLALILSDLDRCEHGRRQAANCFGCEGQSCGNQHLKDRVIGNDISGNFYIVPEHTYDKYEDWLVKRETDG